jgi:hypothetical protein
MPSKVEHFVSAECKDEKCGMCYRDKGFSPASHAVVEAKPADWPAGVSWRPHTQFLCCKHFGKVFNTNATMAFRGCMGGRK